jgi:DNA polymerase III subunit chi
VPEISFYVLASESAAERNLFACKLIEKAYRSGVFPYVLTDSPVLSQALDDLLWTFRAGSFIPHEIYKGEMPIDESIVLIGDGEAPEAWRKTIVNLSADCPTDFQDAERILEILDNNAALKQQGRQRYRQYQQAGIKPVTHDLTSG